MMKLTLLFLAVAASAVAAFQLQRPVLSPRVLTPCSPRPRHRHDDEATTLLLLRSAPTDNEKAGGLDVDEILSAVRNFELPDVSSVMENADTLRANVFSGEFGSRGEPYVAVQAFLGVCILIGGIPFVGEFLSLLLGPVLLLAGLAAMVLAVTDLGAALSPWPVPAEASPGLKTDGLYGKVRHPIYAGLLAAAAGFSLATDSAFRLLLTAALLYALDQKTEYEEAELMKKFPDYGRYKKQVPGKFFPQEILDVMPWSKKA